MQQVTYVREQVKLIGAQLAELSADKDKLREMMQEFYYEITEITQVRFIHSFAFHFPSFSFFSQTEIEKLCEYLDSHFIHQFERLRSFYEPGK